MNIIPERGDVVWITFSSQDENEKKRRQPALVVSPAIYNTKVGFALVCPITRQVNGYPFEVLIPEGTSIAGAVLSDQVMSVDWRVNPFELVYQLTTTSTEEVLQKLNTLLSV